MADSVFKFIPHAANEYQAYIFIFHFKMFVFRGETIVFPLLERTREQIPQDLPIA